MSKLIFKIFRKETVNKFLKSKEYQDLATTINFLQDKMALLQRIFTYALHFFTF
jgi:hypothetical protein